MIGKIFALIIRLMVDKRVPWRLKIIPLAGIIYVISPWDFLPDFIPLLGWIDDIFILIGSLLLFIGLSPGAILKNITNPQNKRSNTSSKTSETEKTIDGEFRIVDDEDEHDQSNVT